MSTFGLALIACVALTVILTGLPAYLVLLTAATVGALAGLATGSFTPAILGSLPPRLFGLLESDVLQALPLYLLMGGLLNKLGIAEAIFKTGTRLLPAGPSRPLISGFLLGGLLGPMNGSVGASVMALSHTLGPRLVANGVPPATREAVVAVASTLGVVVPPSLVLILLGDAMLTAHSIALNATGRMDRIVNTQDLMRGALAPAAIFITLCIAVAWMTARRRTATPVEPGPSATPRDYLIAAIAVTFLVLLLGGVALGKFYAVEAAALGAFAMFVSALVTGRLRDGALGAVLSDTVASTGALFAPLLAATTFTLVLRLLGTDRLINEWVTALPGGVTVAVVMILAAIGLAALALDAFEIIFVAVPILVPPLLMRAPDAVWIGVLILLVLQLSFLLPPFGYALILARATMRETTRLADVVRALRPYLLAQIAVLLLVVAFPALVHFADPPEASAPVESVTPTPLTPFKPPAPAFGLPSAPPPFKP